MLLHRPQSNAHVERIEQWLAAHSGVRSHALQAVSPTAVQMRGPELEIAMLDVIGHDWWTGGGITSQWVKQLLDENKKNVRTVKVLLNSPGGDYFEGVAIHNLLKQSGLKVTVEVLGMAASAASVIAMAGDEIQIHDGAMLMVHEAWSFAMGKASELEATAKLLRQVNESAIDIYTTRTGIARDVVTATVEAETWIKSDEAVSTGWADKRIPAKAKNVVPAPSPEQAPKESRQTKNERRPGLWLAAPLQVLPK